MRESALEGQRATLRLHRSRLGKYVGTGVFMTSVVALLVCTMAWMIGLRLNLSGSITPGLYQVEPGAPTRGSVVLACLPRHIAEFARSRGYIPRGSCDDGSAPVGKTIVAVAGDTVLVRSTGVFVNGRMLLHSRALTVDSRGRTLEPRATSMELVRDGEVWLLSTFSPHSFDSRYYGPISTARILARMRRLERVRDIRWK